MNSSEIHQQINNFLTRQSECFCEQEETFGQVREAVLRSHPEVAKPGDFLYLRKISLDLIEQYGDLIGHMKTMAGLIRQLHQRIEFLEDQNVGRSNPRSGHQTPLGNDKTEG